MEKPAKADDFVVLLKDCVDYLASHIKKPAYLTSKKLHGTLRREAF
jgi:hypothetical protein